METPEYIDECVECLIKAEDIRNNSELMKQVEPALKEKIEKAKKVLSLKDLRKLASDKAIEEQEEADKEKNGKISVEVEIEKEDEDDEEEEPTVADSLKIPRKA